MSYNFSAFSVGQKPMDAINPVILPLNKSKKISGKRALLYLAYPATTTKASRLTG
jgi:hypothetical protein